MDKTNKIKFSLIIALVIITGAVIIFYFSPKRKPKPSFQPSAPTFLQGKITQVEKFPLKLLYPDFSNGKVFYQGYYQGDLLQGEIDTGKIIVLMEKNDLPELDNLVVSPNATKILLLGTKEGVPSRYFLLELKNKNLTPLNPLIKASTFVSEEKIVYQYLDKTRGMNNLSIADPDGKNWKKIIDLDLKDETIFLNTIGTEEILYTASEITNSFSVIKPDGSGKRTIKLPIQTNINKIAWSSDGKSAVAAIRETGKTTDTFYKINLKTGQKEEIKYESQIPIDAKDLKLTKDNKTLYFTSDDYLYQLSL